MHSITSIFTPAVAEILWARRGVNGRWIAIGIALTRRVHDKSWDTLSLTFENDEGAARASLALSTPHHDFDGPHKRASLCGDLPAGIEPEANDLLVLRDETGKRLAFERWHTLAQAAEAEVARKTKAMA